MKLTELTTSLHVPEIAADVELVTDLQRALNTAGYLDPPIDGKWGAVSQWALMQVIGTGVDTPLTPEEAIGISKLAPLPLNPGDDLAGKIIKAMQRHDYWIARNKSCFNIVYVEGMGVDGVKNDNRPNQFNDIRTVIQVQNGVPVLVGIWEATTQPGKYWTENPMNSAGAANIAFGQYKSWVVGTHHPGTAGAHEALVQSDNVQVYRDKNQDYNRDGDALDEGMFGINQHWGYNYPHNDLGRSSAGCLVGRLTDGHLKFMSIIKQDARYQASHGYTFMTAIMPAADIV